MGPISQKGIAPAFTGILAMLAIALGLASLLPAQSATVLIQGTVTDRTTGAPIPGVQVGVGAGAGTVLTDANGNYSLTSDQVTASTGSITLGAAGYFIPPALPYDLSSGTPVTINATMLAGGTMLQGVVTDSGTQAPVSGAQISITTDAGTAAGTSGADGSYSFGASFFSETAVGGFTIQRIQASAPGYFTIDSTVSTAFSPPFPAIQNMLLVPSSGTAIQGTVTDRNTGAPIQGVTVNAGGGSALTDASGNYAIPAAQVSGLTGNVTFCCATGYFNTSGTPYDLTQGIPVTINGTMLPGGTILQGVVTDSSTQAPIPGAALTITTDQGTATGTAGAGGSYSFGASSFYEGALNGFTIQGIQASAPGYLTLSSSAAQVFNPPLPATKNVQLGPNGSEYAFAVATVPSGLTITVDGTAYAAPQTFNWPANSVHSVAASTPQGGAGTQYVFGGWSDGGAAAHVIAAPAANGTYTASFSTQYQLTTSASPAGGGTVTPSGWFDSGASVPVTATANAGYLFTGFTGDLGGLTDPQSIVMNAPKSVTATFAALAAPAITSASSATFTVGSAGSFMVTATGDPVPALSESGTLPAGVTFVDNHNGTGTLSGTPLTDAGSPYAISLQANNGVGTPFAQSFTLTVMPGPPASIAASAGTLQSAAVGTAFATNLAVTVLDAESDPVPGAAVTFTAPIAAAGGAFAGGVTTDTELTNAQGVATAKAFTANAIAGFYAVTASVAGVASPAVFGLYNQPAGSGLVAAWGDNASGELGNNSTMPSSSPIQVAGAAGIGSLSNVVAVAGGQSFTLALKGDGTVWAWGDNTYGELGNGTTTGSLVPVQVSGISGAVAIAAGAGHSLALKGDGTVWAWGNNASGQLGNGGTTNTSVPVQVSSFSGAVAIAAGAQHSLALKGDGTVWAWGSNASGQLGNGSTLNSSLPVQVNNLSGMVAVTAGRSDTLALRSDGTAWAWGDNTYGELGNGTTTGSSVPVQASGLINAVALSSQSGSYQVFALKGDGTVWGWGENQFGELGTGAATPAPYGISTPVQVSNLAGVAAIAGGNQFALALKNDGTLWSWGLNTSGQLANGTSVGGSSLPMQVSGLASAAAMPAIAAGGDQSLAIATAASSAGAATHFAVVAASPQTAGAAFNFTVTAEDANNNTVAGYEGTVQFTSSDGSAVLPAATTLSKGAGTFSATLKTAGRQTITATDTVTTAVTGSSPGISVNAGAAATMTTSQQATPQSATVGQTFAKALSVIVLDANSNPVPGLTVTFTAPGTGASGMFASGASTAQVATGSNGVATATAFTANGTAGGPYNVVASAMGVASANFSLTNAPGTATHFAVSAPSAATAGTAFNFTVTALDSFNNAATGYAGTVHFSSTDAAATLPANTILSGGTGTFAATLQTAGTQIIAATDAAVGSVTGNSGGIVVPITVSISPAAVTLYGGQSWQFGATQNTASQAVTWSIGTASGSISTAGLYTAASTIASSQSVTVTATSVADPTKSASATVTLMPPIAVSITPGNTTLSHSQTQQFTANIQNAPGPVFVASHPSAWTVGYGNYRTGANLAEPVLSPANASSVRRLGSFAVDGYIYAQPLFAGQTTLADGTVHDLLIVATMNNSVFAFDANSPGQAALWSTNLGPTNVSSITNQLTSTTGAGIISTPVIDTTKNLLYVVYQTPAPSYVLAKLNLLTGATLGTVTIGGQVPGTGDASYSDTVSGGNLLFYPEYELQRAGLALANGRIYIAFASWGDARPEHGWLFAYDSTTLSQKGVVCLSPNSWGATVWQSGGAPAVDDSGNIYVVTGNGAGTTDLSEALVKLDPNLNILADFQPSYWMSLSADDEDFAGRPMIVPGQSLLVAGAKNHNLYGLDLGFDGPLQVATEAGVKAGIFNGAIFNGYVYTGDGPIFSHPLNGASIGSQAAATASTYAQAVALSGSCNGTSNCILWATTKPNADGVIAGTLRAFDPNTLTELYDSDAAAGGADTLGTQATFVAPLVINGRVYVPNQNNAVQVYGVPLAVAQTAANQPITGTSVTWMITPNVGSISSSGVYTAPATISTNQTITVVAVSGADWTKSASSTITLLAGPTITSQPQSQTVSAGATATFSVVATGSGLSYQWWSAAPGSSTFAAISGATASSYTTPPVTQAVSGTQYECVVSNALGMATSNAATVGLLNLGTSYIASTTVGTLRNNFGGWVGMSFTVGGSAINVSALGRIFAPGDSGTHTLKLVNASTSQDVSGGSVSVSMSGGTPGSFTYANLAAPVTLNANTTYYLVSLEAMSGDSWYDINTSIQTTGVAAETTGIYSYGGASYLSYGSANQSYGPVSFLYGVSVAQPGITQQPQNQTVSAGMSATFNVTATGGNLSYQWESAPAAGSSFTAIGGATGNSYTVSGTTLAQNGTQYLCVVSNTAGSISSSAATLTVAASLPGTTYVTSATLGTARNNFGGWVGMSFTVGGSAITVSALGRIFAPGDSGTHTLKLVNGSTGQDVSGGSVSISMSGGTPGTFTYASLTTPVTLNANTTYNLVSLEAMSGDAWYDINTSLQTTGVAAETTGIYSYNGASYSSYGSANQSYGPVNFLYGVSVAQPAIAQQPQSQTVSAGMSATFSVGATGGNLSYEWESAPAGSSSFTAISGATGSSYTVAGTTTAQSGMQLQCVVSNTAGSISSSAATLSVVASLPGTTYVTSATLGTARNNFAGWVGMSFTVGGSAINVSALGRIFAPGDSGTHTLKLVNASTSQDVSGGAVSVSMPGGTPGSFVYANLAAPVTLNANSTYYLVSLEAQSGDAWYDINTSLQTTGVAVETTGIYSYNGASYLSLGSANQAYGPLSFLYAVNVSQPAIAQQPQNQTVSAGMSATFGVSATGGNLSYQWESAPAGGSSFTAINGAAASSYTVSGTTTAQNGTQYLCAVSNTAGSISSSAATLTVVASLPGTTYVTSATLGTARNNFAGWVGMSFTMGGSAITVSALGRIFAPGDSGTHTLKLVNGATSQDVSGGSVSVSMPGGTPGSFVYANLTTPVTLNANTTYYLVSLEAQSGDLWYDVNTSLQTTSVAAETTGIYSYTGASYLSYGSGNHSYGPVNFLYTTGN
jgi:alpha-tubulin suppressor-like RCC1 family protein